ncbi:MAG: hypothetical protein M1839_006805 [Geoglossum umbratile]|nr:MAG: hypothetical protein M1839_006805 [Geoglossum umbratile]
MPSKIQLDENLWFLYVCLQKSDFKTIDFNAVGEATGLKAPAARMRYTRLRRHIVDGTLIGTHGTPFQGGPERGAQSQGKRKKNSRGTLKEEEEGPDFIQTRSGICIERRPKSELEASDEYETDSDDERDEMPLAKRRTASDVRGQVKGEKKPALDAGESLAKGPTTPEEGVSQRDPAEPTMLMDLTPTSPRPKVEEHSEALPDTPAATPATRAGVGSPNSVATNVPNQTQPSLELSAAKKTQQSGSKTSPPTPNGSHAIHTTQAPPSSPANPQSGSAAPPSPQAHPIKAEDKDMSSELLVKEEVEDRKIPLHILKAPGAVA